MKKKVIGILYSGKFGDDEKFFLEHGKKKGVQIILINLSKKWDINNLKRIVKKCDLVYNSTAESYSIEIVKTIEEFGRKVIESSRSYYAFEDKWIFYLKCKKKKIPVPKTILLSTNILNAKNEVKSFGKMPVILKELSGTMGEHVERANSLPQVEEILKKFWKGKRKFPVIAQEYIKSPSYRVTLIGNKIVQTALKGNKHGWKATGVYAKTCGRFKVNWKLRKIIDKLKKFVNIKICGIDLLKKNGRWVVLEVNAQPGLDFFQEEREMLIIEALDFLIEEISKKDQTVEKV
jgi:glutathione synthase/RimK-type ligase-like ATP-grasp enzyme